MPVSIECPSLNKVQTTADPKDFSVHTALQYALVFVYVVLTEQRVLWCFLFKLLNFYFIHYDVSHLVGDFK